MTHFPKQLVEGKIMEDVFDCLFFFELYVMEVERGNQKLSWILVQSVYSTCLEL